MTQLLKNRDPLGHAVFDYHHTAKNKRVKVNSDITKGEYIDSSYLFRSIDDMPEIEKAALSLCSGKILDVGACAGAHSCVLQNRNLDVTALELSTLCCEVMHLRGIRKIVNESIYYYQDDGYDTILMLMNGIGIVGDVAGLKKLLNHYKKLLNRNGQILFDSSDIRYMFIEKDGSQWVNLNAEYFGEVTYRMRYKKIQSDPFKWLFIDDDTMKKVADECGYRFELLVQGDHFDYLGKLSLK